MKFHHPILTLLSIAGSSNHPHIGTHLSIKEFPSIIGRGQDASIVIKHRRLSRLHCRLFMKDDRIFIKDLGSTNGTYVDGQKTQGETELSPGSRISVGGIEFMLTVAMTTKRDPSGREIVPTDIANESANKQASVFIPAQENQEADETISSPASENPTDCFQTTTAEDQPPQRTPDLSEHANHNTDVGGLMGRYGLDKPASPPEPQEESLEPLPLLETGEEEPRDQQETTETPNVVYDSTPVDFSPSPSPAETQFRKQIEEDPTKLSEGIHFSNPSDQKQVQNLSIRTGKKKPKAVTEDSNLKGVGGNKPKSIDNQGVQIDAENKPKPQVSKDELGDFFIRRKKKD